MTSKYFVVLATFLAGLGMMVSGLEEWHDAISPVFIGGVLVQLGAVIGGIYAPNPAAVARSKQIAEYFRNVK